MSATTRGARPPSRVGRVLAALVAGLVVGGGLTAIVQQRTIAVLTHDLADVTTAQDRTQTELSTTQAGLTSLGEQNTFMRAQLDAARKQLRSARLLDEDGSPPAAFDVETAEHLPGGQYFGRIVFIQNTTQISVDLEQLFTGARARRQAARDGAISAGQPLPTPYYVRDEVGVARSFPVADQIEIRVLVDGTSPAAKTITMADFIRMFVDRSERFAYLRTGSYDLWLRREQIVRIVQHYLPPAA